MGGLPCELSVQQGEDLGEDEEECGGKKTHRRPAVGVAGHQAKIRWMQDGENTKNENEACAIMLGFPEHIESMTEWKSQYI